METGRLDLCQGGNMLVDVSSTYIAGFGFRDVPPPQVSMQH